MSNLHPTASATTGKPVGEEQVGVHPTAVGSDRTPELHETQSAAPGASRTGEDEGYPEQLHAGAVGIGPHYAETHGSGGIGAKLQGIKEEIKGKITRNPELVQKGHDRMTGELARREHDDTSAFASVGEEKKKDNDSSNAHPNEQPPSSDKAAKEQAGTTHPEGTQRGSEQAAAGVGLEREGGKVI